MRLSPSRTVPLLSLIAVVVVSMGGPTPPKGPPEIPKKPNAVVLAEVKPGPQDPEPRRAVPAVAASTSVSAVR